VHHLRELIFVHEQMYRRPAYDVCCIGVLLMYVEDEPIKAYAQRYGVNKSSLIPFLLPSGWKLSLEEYDPFIFYLDVTPLLEAFKDQFHHLAASPHPICEILLG
jgi:hypothetical protein